MVESILRPGAATGAAMPGYAPWQPPGELPATRDAGLAILEALAAADEPMSVAEIARATGRHRASVYRYVESLSAEGFLRVSGSPRRFSASWRTIRLGLLPLRFRRNRVRDVALASAMRLVQETGAQAVLGFYEDGWAYCSDVVQDVEGMPVPSFVGSAMPGITSGGGRVLLAFSSAAEMERAACAHTPAFTAHTITGHDAVLEELQRTRARGYALIYDELRPGHREVAFPVFDFESRPVVAIGVLFQGDQPPAALVERLRLAASEASRQLGYNPAPPSPAI